LRAESFVGLIGTTALIAAAISGLVLQSCLF